MKKRKPGKFLTMALTAIVSFTMIFGSTCFAQAASYSQTKTAFEKCGDYLYTTVKEPAYGSIGGEWVVYGLANAGYDFADTWLKTYVKTVEDALKTGHRGTEGILHDRKFTEYSRVIVALSAAGYDATDIGGYNLLDPLADFVNVKWQGMNGPIWALRALDSAGYEVPKLTDDYKYGKLTDAELKDGEKEKSRQNSRQRIVDYILANQLSDGGWSLQTKAEVEGASGFAAASDVDMTGMAMTALGPYMKQAKVKKAVAKAITFLSKAQNKDGGFSSWGTVNSESCAQAICGLLACGVNPNTDSRFKKNGKTPIDGLMDFYDAKVGGFRHVNTASGGYEPVVNQMATEQGYYALAHFYREAPSQTKLTKVSKVKKGFIKVNWSKAVINTDYVTKKSGKTSGVSGYQIVLATNKKFSNARKVTVSGTKNVSKTVSGLKTGKTYYVKVRAYKQTTGGSKIYGAYSTVKSCKA